jgi:hypothetical protein
VDRVDVRLCIERANIVATLGMAAVFCQHCFTAR